MSRRALAFALISLAVCLASFGLSGLADAQQPASPRRIGVLLVSFSPESQEAQALRQGLRDAGYLEGRDVMIEWRYADGDYARVSRLVTDVVQRNVEVIVTDVTFAARAAQRATSTIPIVIAIAADPVGSGLVTNLAHPRANITGLSVMIAELIPKRLQLLAEAMPGVTRVAILWDPATPYHTKAIQDIKTAAPALSIEPTFVAVRTPEGFGSALAATKRAHAQALFVIDAPVFANHRRELLALATKIKIPVVSGNSSFASDGALMSYGASFGDLFRRSAGYVDKILKGTKPGDLPIEQPTKFELVVNLKTATALGISIPESILLRADQVIR